MSAPATTFQDLHVWKKAHQLVVRIYEVTTGFPKAEIFGLTSQMRRSAVSVPVILPKPSDDEVRGTRLACGIPPNPLASARAGRLRTFLLTSVFCLLYSLF